MANPGDIGFSVVALPAEAETPEAAVQCLLAELVRIGSLPASAVDEVACRIWARERLGTTAIGQGIAIPHTQVQVVTAVVGVVGRCAKPLQWPKALDGGAVALVCLVLVPSWPVGHLLRDMERVTRRLRGEG